MLINFFNDLINFIQYKKKENLYSNLVFIEGEYLIPYLIYLINKKKKLAIITFEKISLDKKIDTYCFKTFLFKSLFFNLVKVKKIYSSTPDLNNSIFTRSINKNVKYIYIQHSPVSLSMAYKKNAFDNFDGVQVVNEYQFSDLVDINKLNNKKIKAIRTKYFFLQNFKKKKDFKSKKVLIAPTWNTEFYKNKIHTKLKEILEKNKIEFELRPHKMSYTKNEFDLGELEKSFTINKDIYCDYSNFSNLITDWSGIFIEFSLLQNTRAICVNTKKKIRNIKFNDFTRTPIEIDLRDKLAHNIDFKDINNIPDIILSENQKDIEIIESLKNKFFFT